MDFDKNRYSWLLFQISEKFQVFLAAKMAINIDILQHNHD